MAPGRGGPRQVIALVSIDGFPRQRLTLARFTAPRPSLPRVSRATYRVRGGKLSVSWSRVRHAAYYDIQIHFAGSGVTYRVHGTHSHTSFKLARGQRVRSVTVTVAVGGIHGASVKARKAKILRR